MNPSNSLNNDSIYEYFSIIKYGDGDQNLPDFEICPNETINSTGNIPPLCLQ